MQIWGHRGALQYMPENTLPSFQKAIELGADGIELDVQLTKDQEVVVIHDETIDRVSDGKGYVKDFTLAELKRFNFNHNHIGTTQFVTIPLLEEVLKLLMSTTLEINIELKTGIIFYSGLEHRTVDLVKKYGLSKRVIYSSFNHYSLQRVKEYDPLARTALLCGGGTLVTGEQCQKIGAYALHLDTAQMRYPGLIADCHKRGIKVNVWTITNDEDYAFAKANDVDGIFVNDLIKYNENVTISLTEKEMPLFERLEDDLSRQVFLERKKYAEFGFSNFQKVFEKPELFHEIRNLVCNNPYACYGAGIITRKAQRILQSWDAWRNCVAIYDRNENLHGQLIGGVEIFEPPKHAISVQYVLNGVHRRNADGYKSANNYLKSAGVKYIMDACHIVDNMRQQYFDNEIIVSRLCDREVFVDGGCFDFGTSQRLIELAPGVEKIYAFEPAAEQLPFVNASIIQSQFKNVQLEKAVLWSSDIEQCFTVAHGGDSCVTDSGVKIKAVTLDSIIPETKRVTFIKLNVKGSEIETLKGAKRIISQQYPKLAINISHKPYDFIDIMEYLLKIAPRYRFYMRHYSALAVESVLYAIV